MKKMKSTIAAFLSIVLVVSAVLGQTSVTVCAEAAGYGISNPRTDSSGVTTWDCIYFGNYWQRDTNGDEIVNESDAKEPIKWRVLSVEGDDAFLIADQCLDYKKYNGDEEEFLIDTPDITWEGCTLRAWLNEIFYQNAFSQEEGEAIQSTTVKNESNLITDVNGGEDTTDKVYLLSLSEATKEAYGFPMNSEESESRVAEDTQYAMRNGDVPMTWWLRSPGYSQKYAVMVEKSGEIDSDFGYMTDLLFGVRPVLHIDLSASSVWENAGTVTATQPAKPTQKPKPTASVTAMPIQTSSARPTQIPSVRPIRTPSTQQTQKPVVTKKPTATSAPKVTPVPRKPAPATKMKPGEKKAISSFQDLQAMEDIPSGSYYLTKDITVPANTQLFWDYPFTGTLDGRGHKIKGFQVQKKFVIGQELNHDAEAGGGHDLIVEEPCAGIFYQASGATFKNLSLTKVNINVQTEDYATVGALVSQATKCTFNNVHVSGKISVKSIRENPLRYTGFDVGGIVGKAMKDPKGKCGTLTNCSNSANITVNCKNSEYADGAQVGGLSGYGEYSKMTKCTNSGNISLSGYCGGSNDDNMSVTGLVNTCTSISSCTNSGKVTLKVQSAGNKYETPVKLYPYEDPDPPEEIQCLGGAFAAGIAKSADNITSSGNTGKIQMSYNLKNIDGVQLAGVVNIVTNGKKCYNKGAVSYSGKPMREETKSGTGGVFSQFNRTVTQCYNKGKVSDKSDNRMNSGHQMGGVAAFSGSPYAEVTNCYNAGTISSRKGGRVGGVVGYYDGGWKAKGQKVEPRMKYNYNVGKIAGYKKSYIWGSVTGYCGSLLIMQNKHAVFDNYSTGSYNLYGTGPSSKKLKPLGKKVSRITKANCPKLSSKYWVYSPKVKRMVLKNNNETKSVKKVTGKKKKTSKKK